MHVLLGHVDGDLWKPDVQATPCSCGDDNPNVVLVDLLGDWILCFRVMLSGDNSHESGPDVLDLTRGTPMFAVAVGTCFQPATATIGVPQANSETPRSDPGYGMLTKNLHRACARV